jgi:hypothetical protein
MDFEITTRIYGAERELSDVGGSARTYWQLTSRLPAFAPVILLGRFILGFS